jgi:hypothetical protein
VLELAGAWNLTVAGPESYLWQPKAAYRFDLAGVLVAPRDSFSAWGIAFVRFPVRVGTHKSALIRATEPLA